MIEALKKYFGFDAFRPLQEEIVHSVMSGRDVFALMPTGAGKSLCYQLPGALLPGITIVISPLIALMKDQVDSLNATGIPATFLNSSIGSDQMSDRIARLRRGEYKLLYVAPERFPAAGFMPLLDSLNLSLVVIDEAHCISEWGHDFRSDYRNLHVLRTRYPKVPIIALTATATDRVRQDILSQLQLRSDVALYNASFDRPNLTYEVWPRRSALQQLVGYLEGKKGDSGIVYTLSRKGADRLAADLRNNGFKAISYHAGMEKEDRAKAQEKFDRDKVDIICATIAFGMGIDKSNVRFVVHYDLPKSIPGYYQETGRAGRDGLPSDCIAFYVPGDDKKMIRFFDDKPPEERRRSIQELAKVVNLFETPRCRRIELLGYFGEEYPKENCGACDNCLSNKTVATFDATRIAQMFLSCAVRVKEDFGITHIVRVLRGSNDQRILDFRHNLLPTYGIGKAYSNTEWKHFAHEFRKAGLFVEDTEHYNCVRVTKAGWDVLKQQKTVAITRAEEDDTTEPTSRDRGRTQSVDIPAINRALFDELRNLRKQLAEERDVPPFVIFNDSTLYQLASQLPEDGAGLLKIPGIGDAKAKDFGLLVLTCIRNFRRGHPDIQRVKPEYKSIAAAPKKATKPVEGGDSAYITLQYFQKGHSVEKIAELRVLAKSTVGAHLTNFIESGEIESIDTLVKKDKIAVIRKAFAEYGNGTLSPIKAALGDVVTYEDLKFVRAYDARIAAEKENAVA